MGSSLKNILLSFHPLMKQCKNYNNRRAHDGRLTLTHSATNNFKVVRLWVIAREMSQGFHSAGFRWQSVCGSRVRIWSSGICVLATSIWWELETHPSNTHTHIHTHTHTHIHTHIPLNRKWAGLAGNKGLGFTSGIRGAPTPVDLYTVYLPWNPRHCEAPTPRHYTHTGAICRGGFNSLQSNDQFYSPPSLSYHWIPKTLYLGPHTAVPK